MKKSSKVLKCESSKGVYLCVSVSLCETVQTIVTYPFLSCGTNITRYVWGLDISGQSGGRASSQAEMQGAGGVGGLCAVFPDNGITPHYPAYDANGNVTEYVDFIGNTIAHYEYDAFGNITGQSGSMADDFVFRFSTKYLDAETGLCYYGRIRYYKPSFGRFISRDPIEEQGGLNLYGFCGNDPINKVDYLGMASSLTWKKLKKCENKCGEADITEALQNVLGRIEAFYNGLTDDQKKESCQALYSWSFHKFDGELYATPRCINAWDIHELQITGQGDWPRHWQDQKPGTGKCKRTVTLGGKCYHASAVNYTMWGKVNRLCHRDFKDGQHDFKKVPERVETWKKIAYRGSQLDEARAFTLYGYYGVEVAKPKDLEDCSTQGASSIDKLYFTWRPWVLAK